MVNTGQQSKQDNTTLTVLINQSPVQVMCRSGGWTVVQSRGQFGNPKDYFQRNWASYRSPFGVLGEFFITFAFCWWRAVRNKEELKKLF